MEKDALDFDVACGDLTYLQPVFYCLEKAQTQGESQVIGPVNYEAEFYDSSSSSLAHGP
jgi:hypothetical protein